MLNTKFNCIFLRTQSYKVNLVHYECSGGKKQSVAENKFGKLSFKNSAIEEVMR